MISTDYGQSDLSWKTMLYNLIVHLAIIGFTVYITILSFANEIVLFSYHAPLMLVGFLICMTEAILCISNVNIFTNFLSHKRQVVVHWILQTIGVCFITASFLVIIMSKNSKGKSHFITWHAIFGLISIAATVVAVFGGIVARYSFQLRQRIRPVIVKVIHSVLGTIVYILMIFTVLLGLYSNWYKRNSTIVALVVSNVLVMFIVQYVLVQPIQIIYSRVKNIYLRSNL